MFVAATRPRRGSVAVGTTVSSTIVSLLTALQLPAASNHLAYTRRVPFVAGRVHACDGAYGRVVNVVPSLDSATLLTAESASVAGTASVTAAVFV